MSQGKALPAIQSVVEFGHNTKIDAYLLESGEIRYSKTGVSKLLRNENTWLNGLESKAPELLKLLVGKGYTDWSQRVSVRREGKRGATIAETISGDDLDILITVEAERGNTHSRCIVGFRLAPIQNRPKPSRIWITRKNGYREVR
jgi:hypothetical protein